MVVKSLLGLAFELERRLPLQGAGMLVLAPFRRGTVSAWLAWGR